MKFGIIQSLKRVLLSLISPMGVYWTFLLSLIFIFTFLVPPFQKPDEQQHFFKAMALARGEFQCKKGNGNSYFVLPNSVIDFPNRMYLHSTLMKPETKFPIGVLFQKYPFLKDTLKNMPFQYCSFPSVGYIPYALGVLVSMPLNNLLYTFFFLRILSAVGFIISVVISVLIIPKRYRLLLLFFASIPMVIHQTTAISYDAISFSLGILLFSLLCNLLDKKSISFREFCVFIFLTLLFSLVKYGYYFVYIFPILLLSRLWIKKILVVALSGLSIFAALICYFLFADNANAIRNFLLNTQTSPQIFMLQNYPLQFLKASITAALEHSGNMIQGMIGIFGWEDYTLSSIVTNIYIVAGGCVLIMTASKDRKILSPIAIMFLCIIMACNFLFIYAFFYIILTPIAYFEVIGIQGRYFLIFIPFLVYGISQSILYIRQSKFLINTFMSLTVIAMIISMGLLVYNRYFYYGGSFSNPDALVGRIQKGEFEVSALTQIPVVKPISFVSQFPIDGNKIGGFQLLIQNERYVTSPYKYILKDSSCTISLNSGFLNRIKGPKLSHLLGEKDVVYTQYIPVTFVSEKLLCIELIPLLSQGVTPMILLGDSSGVPVVEYLSIIQ